jgi:hypothetical protein
VGLEAGRGLHGVRTRAGVGGGAARLEGPSGDRLVDPETPAAPYPGGTIAGAGGFFEALVALVVREAGAGAERTHRPVLDNAGHTEPDLALPEGIRLVYPPPYTPEPLWTHIDEPIANRHFEILADLDAAPAIQCTALHNDRNRIRSRAGSHWWPTKAVPA